MWRSPPTDSITILLILFIQFADNTLQSAAVPVYVQVLNVNDHAPEFSEYYETYVCENADSGQVRTRNKLLTSKQCYIIYSLFGCIFLPC